MSAAGFQRDDAAAVLEPGDGPRRFLITRPKGGRKTADAAGIALAWLLKQAPVQGRAYAVAVDRDQTTLLLDSIRLYARLTPGLAGELTITESRVVSQRTGASLTLLPADAASAQGLRPDLMIVDELAEWPDTPRSRRLWDTVVQGMEKLRPPGRLVVITAAGDPTGLAGRVRASALKRPADWSVRETAGPLPWLSREALARNEADATFPSVYARWHLNQWVGSENRLTTVGDAEAAASLPKEGLPAVPGYRYVMGVDLAVKRDWAAVVVAHLEAAEERLLDPARDRRVHLGRRVVVDRVRWWEPKPGQPVDLADVELAIEVWAREYRALVVADDHEFARMQRSLTGRGVRSEALHFSVPLNDRIARTLYSLLKDKQIDVPRVDGIVDELGALELVEGAPNVFKLSSSRSSGFGHHDRSIAIGLAAVSLLWATSGAGRSIEVHHHRTEYRFEIAQSATQSAKDIVDEAYWQGRTSRGGL